MSRGALAWLVRDAFLRARSSGFHQSLLVASSVAIAVAFSARFTKSGFEAIWGVILIPTHGADAVQSFLFGMAFGVADVIGVFLLLVATAAFLPTFLDPSSASVLLSKPLGRSTLLFGRSLGVLIFVAFHATFFIVGTFVAIGLGTGIWLPAYLLALPLLLVQFVAFFGASALVAVSTRSTAATILVTTFVWLVSWGMSFGRHLLTGIHVDEATPQFGRVVNLGYQILPKPTDFSLMLHTALGSSPEGLTGVGLRKVQELGLYSPTFAVVSSLAFGVVLFALAAYELKHQDY